MIQKKIKHLPKSNKKIISKNKSEFSSHLKKYFFFVIISCFVFTITSLVVGGQKVIPPTCANSKSCISDLTLTIDNNTVGTFEGRKVYPPKIARTPETPTHSVLGESTEPGEKHIYVDLATQTLVAYQGTRQIFKTLVATGRWGKTPTGNFAIWEKLRSTRMSGGSGADGYDLPNVPYVMYFYHDFGLHGAYWHDNFGHTMSHGCVNLRQVDAKVLYDWADGPKNGSLGTKVSICDKLTTDNQCVQNNPVQR